MESKQSFSNRAVNLTTLLLVAFSIIIFLSACDKQDPIGPEPLGPAPLDPEPATPGERLIVRNGEHKVFAEGVYEYQYLRIERGGKATLEAGAMIKADTLEAYSGQRLKVGDNVELDVEEFMVPEIMIDARGDTCSIPGPQGVAGASGKGQHKSGGPGGPGGPGRNGDNGNDLVLVFGHYKYTPIIKIDASGADGCPGGKGGRGGDGDHASMFYAAHDGGNGGNGGRGGDGGRGGNITIYFNPALEKPHVTAKVDGGSGGKGGDGGAGGKGGDGWGPKRGGKPGKPGRPGQAGENGQPGEPGKVIFMPIE